MKSISSSIVVLSGSALLIGATHGASNNVEALYYTGLFVALAGIAGWAYSLKGDK